MEPAMSEDANWFWSDAGTVRGPMPLSELQRLASTGALRPTSFVHDPLRAAWLAASQVPALQRSFPGGADPAQPSGPAAAPPLDPPPDARCRSCGAAGTPGGRHCANCGQSVHAPQPAIDQRLAEVLCRASILAAPLVNVFALIAPAIAWSLGAENPRVVSEAKSAINCLLTLLIVSVAAIVFGFVGSLLVLPVILAWAVHVALFIYCVVTGIQGLVASARGKPFRFPLAFNLIR